MVKGDIYSVAIPKSVEIRECPCQWYQSNMTQPDRSQPWYHVLVDATDQTTYAAEENLQADTSEQRVRHPWVDRFFSEFIDSHYLRNDEPWPS